MGSELPVQLQLDLIHEAPARGGACCHPGVLPHKGLVGGRTPDSPPAGQSCARSKKLLPATPFSQWSCVDVRAGP